MSYLLGLRNLTAHITAKEELDCDYGETRVSIQTIRPLHAIATSQGPSTTNSKHSPDVFKPLKPFDTQEFFNMVSSNSIISELSK